MRLCIKRVGCCCKWLNGHTRSLEAHARGWEDSSVESDVGFGRQVQEGSEGSNSSD